MKDNKMKLSNAMKGIAFGACSALIAELSKPLIDAGIELIKNKSVYTISIKHELYRIGPIIQKYFVNYPVEMNINHWFDDGLDDDYKIKHIRGWRETGDYTGYTIYHGFPIVLKIHIAPGMVNDAHRDVALLATINTSGAKQALCDFMSEITYEWKKYTYAQLDTSEVDVLMGVNNSRTAFVNIRTFDDVFLKEADKQILKTAVQRYINGYDFYAENNLPNHFGILLHGPGGTGKSSIAQAIAHYANAPLFVMTGDQIKRFPDTMMMHVGQTPATKEIYRVVLIEDIDSGVFTMNRENWSPEYTPRNSVDTSHDNDNTKNVGLATILNTIDGIGSPINVIYIFTTNHIEMLDPALIRPGRCDIVLEIGYICEETLIQFLHKHFPDYDLTDKEIHVNGDITFAELQTKLLLGWSADQIVKYCNKR